MPNQNTHESPLRKVWGFIARNHKVMLGTGLPFLNGPPLVVYSYGSEIVCSEQNMELARIGPSKGNASCSYGRLSVVLAVGSSTPASNTRAGCR